MRSLVRHPPPGSRVLSVDEAGPVELRPHLGLNWTLRMPNRVPATYHRTEGTKTPFVAYDLHSDRLYVHLKRRKRWREFLSFLKYLRGLFSGVLYVIVDNYATHRREEVRQWCGKNDVHLVFTPTGASWLDPVEPHIGAMKEFAIKNSYPRAWPHASRSIRRYVSWRNRNSKDAQLLRVQERNNHA